METKHTTEYAKELSNGLIPKDNKEAFIEGYMSAIKQSAAPELLEVLIEITGLLKFTSLSEKDTFRISYQSAINAINKATK